LTGPSSAAPPAAPTSQADRVTRFDRFVADLRHRKALEHIRPGNVVCDVGCGVDALFLRAIWRRDGDAGHLVGLDYQQVTAELPGAEFVHADAVKGFPLEPSSVDHVTMLALIEHLEEPRFALEEAFRVLRPGGTLILTWPAALVDPLLDVLAAIGVVAEEMEAHNHQPRRPVAAWRQLLLGIGFERIEHQRFELGLNHLLVAAKPVAGALVPVSPSRDRNR